MNDIGLKQLHLIKKVKRYFRKLNLKKIDVSKSSFCYIPSYGLNPGNTKLLKWIDKKLINIQNFKIIFNHILAITSYHNYKLLNSKQKNYKYLFITWGKKKNFKKKIFADSLLNVDSNINKKSLFLVIYLEKNLPKIVPKNVILIHKKNYSRSLIFFFKELFKNLIRYNFNLKKFMHYFSAQTIFAEKINKYLKIVLRNNEIDKVILPYEGQPFQNFILNNLNKKIKTYGIIHSILPALPTNLVKRKGSPKFIFVSGMEQKKTLINFLGWNKKQIKINKSLRFKKDINKDITGSIFFTINLSNINEIILNFEKVLDYFGKHFFPFLKIRNHPAMVQSRIHLKLKKNLEKLIEKEKYKINKKSKKNLCIFIGPTSSVIEFLAKKFQVIHIPTQPILDIYSKKIYPGLISIKKEDFFIYKKLNKNNIILFGNNNYNFKNLKII